MGAQQTRKPKWWEPCNLFQALDWTWDFNIPVECPLGSDDRYSKRRNTNVHKDDEVHEISDQVLPERCPTERRFLLHRLIACRLHDRHELKPTMFERSLHSNQFCWPSRFQCRTRRHDVRSFWLHTIHLDCIVELLCQLRWTRHELKRGKRWFPYIPHSPPSQPRPFCSGCCGNRCNMRLHQTIRPGTDWLGLLLQHLWGWHTDSCHVHSMADIWCTPSLEGVFYLLFWNCLVVACSHCCPCYCLCCRYV